MNVLQSVSEGMKVVDASNHEIGTVEYVKLVDTDPSTGQPIARSVDTNAGRTTLLGVLAEAFTDDDIPEEIRRRLLQSGFIRMDVEGLFNADRYVMPNQISGVSGDKVMLKVSKDQLAKAH